MSITKKQKKQKRPLLSESNKSWIEKLKIKAEAGELDESSLDPAVLLEISPSKINQLKSKATKKHQGKQTYSQKTIIDDLFQSNTMTHIFKANKACVFFCYTGARVLNQATAEVIEKEIKNLIAKFQPEKTKTLEGWNIVFNANASFRANPSEKKLEKSNTLLIDFSQELTEQEEINSEILFLEKKRNQRNTFLFENSKIKAGKTINDFHLECFFNPFFRKNANRTGIYKLKMKERLEIMAETLVPVLKALPLKEQKGSRPNKTQIDPKEEQIIQDINDIEILQILFSSLANDLAKEFKKNQKETKKVKRDFQKKVNLFLESSSEKRRLEKQLESLNEIAKETGIDFSKEIKNLEKNLDLFKENQKESQSKVKTTFQKQKELESRNQLLQKEMAGHRGEQLFRSLTELKRIRENRCVSSAQLETKTGKLYMNIVLCPLVMKTGTRKYLVGPLNFRIALTTNFISLKWIWDKNNPSSRLSPHPHVAQDGYTCWGEAESPIRDAIKRKEFSTVIRYITGWASIYNASSPYVSLTDSSFQRTNLSVGWHPEL